jgi:hypothetical protein
MAFNGCNVKDETALYSLLFPCRKNSFPIKAYVSVAIDRKYFKSIITETSLTA